MAQPAGWMWRHCRLWRNISSKSGDNNNISENETKCQFGRQHSHRTSPHVPLLPQQQLEKTASQPGSSQWSKQCWPSRSRSSPRGSQWWWPAANSWTAWNMLLSSDVCLDDSTALKASAFTSLAVVGMHRPSHLNGFFSSSVMKFSWFLGMQIIIVTILVWQYLYCYTLCQPL